MVYRPGLLAEIWRGERPLPEIDIGQSLPPTLRIVSPEQGSAVESRVVTLGVEALDQGGGIEGPWLMQNDVRVRVDERPVRDGNVLRWQFDVTLVEGQNELEILAASADGSWESEPARIELVGEYTGR